MEDHIVVLERRIRAFDQEKDQLDSLSEQLLPIIHWPGWTTPAELAFVELAMESLEHHAESVARLQRQLVKAAGLVGTGSETESVDVQQTAKANA